MADSIEQIQDAIMEIQPELEARRKKFIRSIPLGMLAIIAGITLLFFILSGTVANSQISIMALSFVSCAMFALGTNIRYRTSTKKQFLTKLSENTGLTWHKNGVFPIQELVPHCILPACDRHRIVDGFEGHYKDIPLSFQEIILSDLRPDPNDSKKTREYLKFWGFAVRIKLRRPLSSHTVVMPDSALNTFFRTKFSDFKKINLVSNKFEKKYDVMGTDQVEGRVILDPSFIERFMETGEMIQSKWMETSFKGDEVVFIIQRHRPVFEIGPLWKKLDEEYLQKSTQEIGAVLRIIDVLKLNPKVGI